MGAQLFERVETERESWARLDRDDDPEGLQFLQRFLLADVVLLGQRRRYLSLHRLAVGPPFDIPDFPITLTLSRELAVLDLIEDEQVGEALPRLRHRSRCSAR